MTNGNIDGLDEQGVDLAGWRITRNTISDAWNENHRLRRGVPPSTDPSSDFQRYTVNMTTLINNQARHADTGLRFVDEATATSSARAALLAAANEADLETDRIVNATKKLEQATKAVDAVTKAVAFAAKLVMVI